RGIVHVDRVVAISFLQSHRHACNGRDYLAFRNIQPRQPEATLIQPVLDGDCRQTGAHRREEELGPTLSVEVASALLGFAPRALCQDARVVAGARFGFSDLATLLLVGLLPDVDFRGQAICRADEASALDVEPEGTNERSRVRVPRYDP